MRINKVCVLIPTLLLSLCMYGAEKPARTISNADLLDRIRGGWAGQMIGVTYGAPTEFRYLGRINEDPRQWQPEELAGALDQDDLYVEMTFAAVMDRLGLEATTQQHGEAFRDSKYSLWHANLAARRLLRRGVTAPASGAPPLNVHANDIDFQIESDFVGLMSPGLPKAAQRYALRVGHVMNYGDGVYGGVFVAAMYSAAFFETNPRKVVEAGLAAIPAGSHYAEVIRDVLAWSAQNDDWMATWQLLEDKWDKNDLCPSGALTRFNIDAALNGAYIALGLLYGGGDFEKTMDIAMRSGQDSDCNPSSAAGIIGTMIGYKRIPARWTEKLPDIADRKFSYTEFSFNSIVNSTVERAKKVVREQGGSIQPDRLAIPYQMPDSIPLEQFAAGVPVERIGIGDSRWQRQGEWKENGTDYRTLRSNVSGAQMSVVFEGTGAVLTGTLTEIGGRYHILLDGKQVASGDSFNDDGERSDETLWATFDLPAGRHEVRIAVTGQPYPGSKGALVDVHDLIVYRK